MQKKKATTKKGSRNVMGAELCLAHDMEGGSIGGPLSVDMWPYGCFIYLIFLPNLPNWPNAAKIKYPLNISKFKIKIFISFGNVLNYY